MKKSTSTLLVLLLSGFCSCINTPCQAQTIEETKEVNNKTSADNILSNENQNVRSPLNDAVDSANVKSTIVSENSENTAAVKSIQTNSRPSSRRPIPCRFYAAPSMQQ